MIRRGITRGQAGWPAEWFSDGANLCGLRTLRPLGHVVLDLLVLFESAIPARIDRGEVDENVRAPVVRGDETKALVRVEPLYGPLSHFAMCPSRCSVIRTSRASAWIAIAMGNLYAEPQNRPPLKTAREFRNREVRQQLSPTYRIAS